MNVTVVRPAELSPEQVALWGDFQRNDPSLASPFFHPEFTFAVADVRDDVYVAVIEDSASVLGFLPFQRGRLPVGAPVGAGRSNYHGLIGARDAECDPISLVRASGLGIWDFHHLPVSQRPFKPFHVRTGDSYCVDVSDGFSAYARLRRQAGSKIVRRAQEKARRIERELGPLHLEPHVGSDLEVLDTMMRWKSRQYRRTRMVDRFASAWNVRLLQRVHNARVDGFEGMLIALYAGEDLVAVDMGLRSRHVFHSWFPAYDEQMARYSPGLVLFLTLFERAEDLGLGLIDLGKDHALYKERMATHTVSLAEGSVLVPSAAVSLRRARRAIEHRVGRTPFSTPARSVLRRARSLGAKAGVSAGNAR
jgi:CelD/BcsL family acetyltransferase involved in cellulose biosynthesis